MVDYTFGKEALAPKVYEMNDPETPKEKVSKDLSDSEEEEEEEELSD